MIQKYQKAHSVPSLQALYIIVIIFWLLWYTTNNTKITIIDILIVLDGIHTHIQRERDRRQQQQQHTVLSGHWCIRHIWQTVIIIVWGCLNEREDINKPVYVACIKPPYNLIDWNETFFCTLKACFLKVAVTVHAKQKFLPNGPPTCRKVWGSMNHPAVAFTTFWIKHNWIQIILHLDCNTDLNCLWPG